MAKTKPFDLYSQEYDKWFDEHQELYRLEITALRTLADTISSSRGLEIGVGSGMFAVPLKVKIGVDPSFIMAKRAKAKISKSHVASQRPFPSSQSLLITVSWSQLFVLWMIL